MCIRDRADTLMAFLPAEKQDYRVIYSDGESDSLYAEEMLSSPEPYAVYLKGNQALTEIRNESLEGGTLLVLKDSYGNAMIPFLANHFETIYVIDQRYWRGDPEVFMAVSYTHLYQHHGWWKAGEQLQNWCVPS